MVPKAVLLKALCIRKRKKKNYAVHYCMETTNNKKFTIAP